MTIHVSILAWRIAWTEELGSPWGHKELDTTEQLTHSEEENELPREPGKEFEPNAEKGKNKIKISFQKCISTSKQTSVLKLYLQLLTSHT